MFRSPILGRVRSDNFVTEQSDHILMTENNNPLSDLPNACNYLGHSGSQMDMILREVIELGMCLNLEVILFSLRPTLSSSLLGNLDCFTPR